MIFTVGQFSGFMWFYFQGYNNTMADFSIVQHRLNPDFH